MPKDLRMTIPVINADAINSQQPPDGVLFPNIVRADRDNRPQSYDGIQKLAQQVYLEIINDTLPDNTGSGLATQLQNAQPSEFASIARVGVARVAQKMLQYQQGVDLPLDEKLFDLQLLNLEYDEITGYFHIDLQLIAQSGDQTVIRPPIV